MNILVCCTLRKRYYKGAYYQYRTVWERTTGSYSGIMSENISQMALRMFLILQQ